MRPRILLRTHYQADEPRLIIAIVTERCSSPTESRSEEAIAAALERWARKNNYTVSTPAVVYAVDNARHLGLLDNSNRWTASGLALAFLHRLLPPSSGAESRLLTSVEERLYLKLYLAGNGALVIKFAKWLIERGSTTDEQLRKESIIEHLMIEALDEYLSLTTGIRERTAIRKERDRLGRAEYAASTKRHKRYPLLTTMLRLRLLQQRDESGGHEMLKPDTNGRLAAISRAIPDVDTLERLIRANKLQETLDVEMREYARLDLPTNEKPPTLLLHAYAFAMDVGMQACPISYLDDVLDAFFPASPAGRSPSAEKMLEPIHKEKPGEVRFHVDRRGQRAFVLISEKAIEHLKNTAV